MDCAGTGKVYRFAQIVAAATLALEISASAAMATTGSENFSRRTRTGRPALVLALGGDASNADIHGMRGVLLERL